MSNKSTYTNVPNIVVFKDVQVNPPGVPGTSVGVSTNNVPFEKIKHLMSKKPLHRPAQPVRRPRAK